MKSWKEKSDPASLGSYRRASVSARGRYRDRVQSAGRKNRSRAPMLRLRSVRSAQARVLVLRRLLARTLAVSLMESQVLALLLFPYAWEMISLPRMRHWFLTLHLRSVFRSATYFHTFSVSAGWVVMMIC